MSDHSNRSRSWVSLTDKWLIRKQRVRLALVNMAVLAVIWSGLSLLVYTLLAKDTDHSIDQRLAGMAQQVISQQMASGFSFEAPELHGIDGDLFISIWNMVPQYQMQPHISEGTIYSQDLLLTLSHMAQQNFGETSYKNVTSNGTTFRVLEVQLSNHPRRVLQITEDIGPQLEVLYRLLGLLLLAGFVGILFTIIGGYSLGLWTLRPLMAARKREQEFVTDISHELRTPLSVMMTHLELLLRHVEDPLQDHLNWMEAIYSENRRMAHLVDDLLDMARIEAGEQFVKAAPVSIVDVCQEVTAVFEMVLAQKGLAFTTSLPDQGYVFGDSLRLRQLLTILLDNAQKYTVNGSITLSVVRTGVYFDITVADTGIGIAPDLLAKVTERFVRGDVARTRAKSTGLGLAIAKRIVSSHQGKMTIQSEVGKGTEITIRLRAYDQSVDKLR